MSQNSPHHLKKLDSSRFCENTAVLQRTGTHNIQAASVLDTRGSIMQDHLSIPMLTKASELVIWPIFKGTLLSCCLCSKKSQFSNSFASPPHLLSAFTVVSWRFGDNIHRPLTHCRCESVLLYCQWQAEHCDHLFHAYFPLWKQYLHIYLSKNQMNHLLQQQKSWDAIPSRN